MPPAKRSASTRSKSPRADAQPQGKRSERPVALAEVSLLGIGSCVPEGRMTNADLSKLVDTSDEWIRTRTGIQERRILVPGQRTSDLAGEIDPILVATATPDFPVPCTAAYVQAKLGASHAMGFDVDAGCTGFI